MPANAVSSPEWAAAYKKAEGAATLSPEKEMIRLLALPIPASDKVGISQRVKSFQGLVANAPVKDLKQIEAKLSDDRSGLGRLSKLELSTPLRSDLLARMRNRIGRDEAGLNPAGRGTPN